MRDPLEEGDSVGEVAERGGRFDLEDDVGGLATVFDVDDQVHRDDGRTPLTAKPRGPVPAR